MRLTSGLLLLCVPAFVFGAAGAVPYLVLAAIVALPVEILITLLTGPR